MTTVASIMADLKAKGKEQTRKLYARRGVPHERMFGVSIADLKVIAKTIKGEQALAGELYETGNLDAMYLAGIVADGRRMSKKELEAWAKGAAGMQMIAEYTVPWVAVESPHARELALKWMRSKAAHVASAGWNTYSGLVAVTPDEKLDLPEIEGLLGVVVKEIHGAPDRVKCTMNAFVIAVGAYVSPLSSQAKEAAQRIGTVSVDMGETACKVPIASDSIAKIESMGRAGKKRATIRC